MLRKFQLAPNGSVFMIICTIIYILLLCFFAFFSKKHSLFRKKIKCKRKLEVDFLTDSIEPLKIDWDNIESLSFKKYWMFFGKMFLVIKLKEKVAKSIETISIPVKMERFDEFHDEIKEKVCPTQKLHKSR